MEDHQQLPGSKHSHAAQPKGVYSKAIKLVVDDTTSLWNQPPLPQWEDQKSNANIRKDFTDPGEEDVRRNKVVTSPQDTSNTTSGGTGGRKQKRVHLVILTHGLHSNVGADMLYLKESIDEAARQAREDSRRRRASLKKQEQQGVQGPTAGNGSASKIDATDGNTRSAAPDNAIGEEDEEVIVRGFTENVIRTEKGIKYLGKRMAKYVLSMTYPQQPFVEVKQSTRKAITRTFTGQRSKDDQVGRASHSHSSIHKLATPDDTLAYKITSISFIGHSLGGLVQTYAVAYIQKHAPHFFEEINPVNFVALATPFLGLSNENPIYVKFALDSGIVGRTGKDLGLTWRAPTIARNGWGAVVGGLGSSRTAEEQQAPGTKPLLRILPTGPAHVALKLFRNRTVYSNVVNDGIVPLRTSCLLFLDWSGLDRVEKARRENGLVGTVAGWGWAELTGANTSPRRDLSPFTDAPSGRKKITEEEETATTQPSEETEVPQPSASAVNEDALDGMTLDAQGRTSLDRDTRLVEDEAHDAHAAQKGDSNEAPGMLDSILTMFRSPKSQSHHHPIKPSKLYKRGQTVASALDSKPSHQVEVEDSPTVETSSARQKRSSVTRGDTILEDPDNVHAPPKTTFFESAGDLLNPPLPPTEFLIDPSSRPRTIFHDRVYHPEDIPPAPERRRTGLLRRNSSLGEGLNRISTDQMSNNSETPSVDSGGMKVEEKIARAYHRDLSWRKVLVRLEPDAHNNMIVRRMFANAYGWPVVKHLVDTHFADTYAATTRDDDEPCGERAKSMDRGVGSHGGEVKKEGRRLHNRTESELREASDGLGELDPSMTISISNTGRPFHFTRQDSAQWTDAAFDLTDDDEPDSPREARKLPHLDTSSAKDRRSPSPLDRKGRPSLKGTEDAEIADFLTASPAQDNGGTRERVRLPSHLRQQTESSPEVVNKPPASPKERPASAGSLTATTAQVGLHKPIEDSLGSAPKLGHGEGSDGVMEQVARWTSKGSQERP